MRVYLEEMRSTIKKIYAKNVENKIIFNAENYITNLFIKSLHINHKLSIFKNICLQQK